MTRNGFCLVLDLPRFRYKVWLSRWCRRNPIGWHPFIGLSPSTGLSPIKKLLWEHDGKASRPCVLERTALISPTTFLAPIGWDLRSSSSYWSTSSAWHVPFVPNGRSGSESFTLPYPKPIINSARVPVDRHRASETERERERASELFWLFLRRKAPRGERWWIDRCGTEGPWSCWVSCLLVSSSDLILVASSSVLFLRSWSLGLGYGSIWYIMLLREGACYLFPYEYTDCIGLDSFRIVGFF